MTHTAIQFFADWCETCHKNEETVAAVFADRPDITLLPIDIDDDPMIAFKYGVRSIPVIVLLRDDTVIGRVEGAVTPTTLAETLQMLIPQEAAHVS